MCTAKLIVLLTYGGEQKWLRTCGVDRQMRFILFAGEIAVFKRQEERRKVLLKEIWWIGFHRSRRPRTGKSYPFQQEIKATPDWRDTNIRTCEINGGIKGCHRQNNKVTNEKYEYSKKIYIKTLGNAAFERSFHWQLLI